MKIRKIKLLETDKNKKGDLFSRLMGDLFYALGYDEPRYDIHKSGREIDIEASHRTEKKIALAECKAHGVPIGGDDINKFIGALDAERRKRELAKKDSREIVGYFVSLSGFKETAIEQEIETGDDRVILLKPDKIVQELIAGKILVSIERAISCISLDTSNFYLADYVDLLGHERGWIWVLYYNDGQMNTHYAFVHAEGQPLIQSVADEIIENNIEFDHLKFIVSRNNKIDLYDNREQAKNTYFEYLKNECGEIHFEGLPTDKDSGSVKVKLESIFIPVHLQEQTKQGYTTDEYVYDSAIFRVGLGEAISTNKKMAILAKPGGGKSTLIKRLCIAYAYPDRRLLVDDKLPDIDLIPIFIRCRELGDQVQNSITDIIKNLPAKAEISYLNAEFSLLISEILQKGNALILIDGLDEISEERNRVVFVNQLRVFLSTYPNLYVVITSREAGFRAVSGVLAGYCSHYNLSHLSDEEITELTIKWHKTIIDDSINTLNEAKSLARLILQDGKIYFLARNPLLLTTLLFVKRWVGYLPTKRNVLYQEMIKLLLVTWNVEGHEQLDIDEAEPQLAYVAFWMMNNGKQTINSEELKDCLYAARKQMPDILNYTKISVPNFIKRVESRSSLLIMAGHQRTIDGLLPIYEFLHLSFQEYLAAKAIVEKYLPESENDFTALEIVKPYLLSQSWKEIIPLVSVLLKRQSKYLIEYLMEIVKYPEDYDISLSYGEVDVNEDFDVLKASFVKILGNCLANEILISPDTLEEAIECYIKESNSDYEDVTINNILNSKFGDVFRSKIQSCFFEEFDTKYTSTLSDINARVGFLEYYSDDNDEMLHNICKSILANNGKEKLWVLFCFTKYCYQAFDLGMVINLKPELIIEEIYDEFLLVLKNDDSYLSYGVCGVLTWMPSVKVFKINETTYEEIIEALIYKWLFSKAYHIKLLAAKALTEMLSPNTNLRFLVDKIPGFIKLVKLKLVNFKNEYDKYAALFISINLSIDLNFGEVSIYLNKCKSLINVVTMRDLAYANYLGIYLSARSSEYVEEDEEEEDDDDDDDFL